ncbi:DUF3152 domain-containing protein [Streptomyces sp. ISL-98]|uniref:DUF3152 domain-containing protein n=1 Tax=Streptomyces sp. ISL-98 TaxID=2819192 RepID=UPI0035B0BE04
MPPPQFQQQQQVRGGHPEQYEGGGGWGAAPGRYGDWRGAPRGPQGGPQGGQYAGPQGGQSGGPPGGQYAAPHGGQMPQAPGAMAPGQGHQPPPQGQFGSGVRVPGPRQEFVAAFDGPRTATAERDVFGSVTDWDTDEADGGRTPGVRRPGLDADDDGYGDDSGYDQDVSAKGGKGRAFTGIAAAAVTTVLAVVVAGQVAQGDKDPVANPATGDRSTDSSDASRSDDRPTPSQGAVEAPATYEQLMARTYPIDPKLTADGKFDAVSGFDKAPGRGQKFSYRVDVEKGLKLDAGLFAKAVHLTLNDNRSWAHNGAMTFERISSGRPDFVITLASPGTTGVWCAKSGLETLSGNVSCDSAATERVMINAYRWAQGAETFGKDKMLPYRQMLINHEVGHRLGHGHKNCQTPGELAPIMQQQTKSLDIDGIKCRPNPWVYPGK